MFFELLDNIKGKVECCCFLFTIFGMDILEVNPFIDNNVMIDRRCENCGYKVAKFKLFSKIAVFLVNRRILPILVPDSK